jgi:hypothetical protein
MFLRTSLPMQPRSIDVTRRSACELMALSPPYKTVHGADYAPGRAEPPLGTIFFGDGSDTLVALAEVTLAVHRWGWVIPCIVAPMDRGSLESLLMLVSELRGRLAIMKQARNSPMYDGSVILAAVRNRKPPNSDVLAGYLRGRLEDDCLRDAVAEQFHQALSAQPPAATASASTYSRLFAPFGPYTARDWRAIARLCVHCAVGGTWTSPGVLPLRTARHYFGKYLQLPYHILAERAGWEWILEGALRTGRYVTPRS